MSACMSFTRMASMVLRKTGRKEPARYSAFERGPKKSIRSPVGWYGSGTKGKLLVVGCLRKYSVNVAVGIPCSSVMVLTLLSKDSYSQVVAVGMPTELRRVIGIACREKPKGKLVPVAEGRPSGSVKVATTPGTGLVSVRWRVDVRTCDGFKCMVATSLPRVTRSTKVTSWPPAPGTTLVVF